MYKYSITTNFYKENGFKKIPEQKVPHKCLSIIILDSVIYAYEKYHPETFLEECKYVKENVNQNQNLIAIVIVIMILKNKSDISNNNK